MMSKLLPSDKIYVTESKMPNAGRGVFARVVIKKGELIERCPVIQIPSHDEASVNESMLVTYIYYLGKDKNRPTITLGFGSIYNHTYSPNAEYQDRDKEQVIDFVAIRDINEGEEITVNYNQGYQKDKSPLWFEA